MLLGMYMADIGYTYDDILRMFGHDPDHWHVTFSGPNLEQTRCDLTRQEYEAVVARGGPNQDEINSHCKVVGQNEGEIR
jgi:hypothetical protein